MHATLDRAASPCAIPAGAIPAGATPVFCFHTELKASLPKLRRYGLMLTRNRAAMEDLVQDAVVRALAAQAGFAPGSNFSAWIGCILRNEFISGLRRNRLFTACDPVLFEKIAVAPRQEGHLVLRELVAAIDRLPASQREALLLATVDGLSHTEIAATMHCQEGTVKSRIGRARLQLERELTGTAEGDAPAAARPIPVKRRSGTARDDASPTVTA
jgi:RNA polymerase sigma-70 factor (ECF subfamily)